jgi:trimeric autotransporter adhesin
MFPKYTPAHGSFVSRAARIVSLALCLSCAGVESTGPQVKAVGSVSLSSSALTLAVGAIEQITATLKASDGSTLTGRAISWSSSSASVASVSNGTVTALAAGDATITATSEGKSASVQVTVYVPVASVGLSPTSPKVFVGSSITLKAATLAANGDTLTGRTVLWSSDSVALATVTQSGVVTGIAKGVAKISGVSEGKVGTTSVTVQMPVATVAVTPTPTSVFIGATRQFVASLKDAAQAVLTDRTVIWTSSDTARLTVDANGLATGKKTGSATVTATAEGKSGAATVTIQAPVATVAVSAPLTKLNVGVSTQMKAVLLSGTGDTLTGRDVVWGSSDTSAITVSGNGVALGKKVGAANITATSETKTGTLAMSVVVPVASVAVTPATMQVVLGSTKQLTAQPKSAAGDALADRVITWTSGAPSVAKVEDGAVTGLSLGTATITAASEGVSGTSSITVVPVPVKTVEIAPASASLKKYDLLQLTAVTKDSTGATLTGRAVSWSTITPGVVEVSAAGEVFAAKVGTGSVVATSEGKADTIVIAVAAPEPIATVTFTPATPGVRVYEDLTLVPTLKNAAGTVLLRREMTWSSSSTANATVTNGVVRGVAVGSSTISIQSDAQTFGVVVAVTAAVPVAVVEVSSPPVDFYVGSSSTLFAVLRDAAGNTLANRPVTWASGNSAIVKVTQAGALTPVALGATEITATSLGVSSSVDVSVDLPPVKEVRVAPASPKIALGDSLLIAATVIDVTGKTDTDRDPTWSSSNPDVITVSSTGMLQAMAQGTATITASVEGISGSTGVTVTPPGVENITIDPNPVVTFPNSTITPTAVTMDKWWNPLTGRTVTWTSANPAIMKVTSAGLVTGVGIGSTTLTATSEGASFAVAASVIDYPIMDGIKSAEVSPTTATINVGKTVQLSGVLRDYFGRAMHAFPGAVWYSNDTTRAKVSPTGLVTGVGAGSVAISYGTYFRNASAGITVQFSTAPIAAMSISPNPIYVGQDATRQIALNMTDAAGLGINPALQFVTWTSSNPTVVDPPAGGYPPVIKGNAVGTAQITATVNGKTATATVNVTATAGTYTIIAPNPARVAYLQKLQLSTSLKDPAGLPIQHTTAWSTSDASKVSVNSSTGEITGQSLGTATISARTTVGTGTLATVTVTVVAPTADSIAIVPKYPTLGLSSGSTGSVVLVSYLNNGTTSKGGGSWTSSAPDKVSVAPMGDGAVITTVTAGNGRATITATKDGKTATAIVGVGQNTKPLNYLYFLTPPILLGETKYVQPTLRDVEGTSIGAGDGRTVTWTSSNPSVIKVAPPSFGGYGADWTALSPGTTVITATCEGISQSETVTVGADGLPALEVVLNRSLYDALPGTTVNIVLTAVGVDMKPLGNAKVTWTSSNTSVVTVSASTQTTLNGISTMQAVAKAVGVATITASVGGKTISVPFTVANRLPVRAVSVSLYRGRIAVGATDQGTATLRAFDGTVIPNTGRVISWSSMHPAIATIPAATGLATGLAAGVARITATAEGVQGWQNLTVVDWGSVQVIPATSTIAPGSSVQLTAKTLSSTGAVLARSYSWSSSNTSVATVSASGLVTAKSAGTVTIRAQTNETESGNGQVTVTAPTTTGGGGSTGGGTGGGSTPTSDACSYTQPFTGLVKGSQTGWVTLPYPGGIDIKVTVGTYNHGTAAVPRYQYNLYIRNNRAEKAQVSEVLKIGGTAPTETVGMKDIAPGGTVSDWFYGEVVTTVWAMIAHVYFNGVKTC